MSDKFPRIVWQGSIGPSYGDRRIVQTAEMDIRVEYQSGTDCMGTPTWSLISNDQRAAALTVALLAFLDAYGGLPGGISS